jgi:uncharacterized membrane protein
VQKIGKNKKKIFKSAKNAKKNNYSKFDNSFNFKFQFGPDECLSAVSSSSSDSSAGGAGFCPAGLGVCQVWEIIDK